jgi:UDP-N-acetylmuramyl pentapeptide phosphotransferase/UDP-N-acetylglucosamine-1-phosphate transferase
MIDCFNSIPILGIVFAYILAIGLINAYNFMDGINGITGLYTLVVIGSLLYVNQISTFYRRSFYQIRCLPVWFFYFLITEKKAKCFAGDVGSIAIAFG